MQQLQATLDKMEYIMQNHHDRDVLETCAKTLEFLCSENSAIYTRCDIARGTIIETCVNRYKEAIDEWRNLIAGEETPDEDEIYNVVSSLKKVAILYSCHNLNEWNLFDSLYQDIDENRTGALGDKSLPTEVSDRNLKNTTNSDIHGIFDFSPGIHILHRIVLFLHYMGFGASTK